MKAAHPLAALLAAVVVAPASAKDCPYYHSEHGGIDQYPIVRFSASGNEIKKLKGKRCKGRRPSAKAQAAIEEIKRLRQYHEEAVKALERSAAGKADLDTATVFMLQRARQRVDDGTKLLKTVVLRSNAQIFDVLRDVKKEYQRGTEIMKTVPGGLAVAEPRKSPEAKKAAALLAARSDNPNRQPSLAKIPETGKQKLTDSGFVAGPGTQPRPAPYGASRDVVRQDKAEADLVAIREKHAGRTPSALAVPAFAGIIAAPSASLGPFAAGDGTSGKPLTAPVPMGTSADEQGADDPGADASEATAESDPPEARTTRDKLAEGPRLVQAAWDLIHAGDYAGAEKQALRALKLDPKNAAALEVLALAQLKQGKYAEAVRSASIALGIDPARANAYAFRAYAKELLGDRLGSLADIEAAARLDSRYEEKFRLARSGSRLYDPFKDPLRPPVGRASKAWVPYGLLALFLGAAGAWRRRGDLVEWLRHAVARVRTRAAWPWRAAPQAEKGRSASRVESWP